MKKHPSNTVIEKIDKCWIVCSETLKIVGTSRLAYEDTRVEHISLKTQIRLYPYSPTLGCGKRSYWGDGPYFKTKKDAQEEQKKVIKRELKELRNEYDCEKKKIRISYEEKIKKRLGS